MNVTNQIIQVTERAVLHVICAGGQNPNWKMGFTTIPTNKSAIVYQFKGGIAVLFIQSLETSNAGTYTCHMNGTQEHITFGESLIC